MGIAQYDPAAKGRPAWNAGKQVGAKRALKVKQIWLIRFPSSRRRIAKAEDGCAMYALLGIQFATCLGKHCP